VYGLEVDGEKETLLARDEPKANMAAAVVVVPPEFLDDLTNELMRMPMRLPSDKTVDKATLDK